MSKKNAEKFLADVSTNANLQEKLLAAAASVGAWLVEAASAGYQFSADELRSAAEVVVGKPVAQDDLLGTVRSLFNAGELLDESLDGVTGGSGVAGPQLTVTTRSVSHVLGNAGNRMDDPPAPTTKLPYLPNPGGKTTK